MESSGISPNVDFEIRPLEESQLDSALEVIHRSFATVAEEFGFTRENCPAHTSFIPIEKLLAQRSWGWSMFGAFLGGKMIGYASVSLKESEGFKLHNLAVLPEYRRIGCGKALVDHAKELVRKAGGRRLEIGIVNESEKLKRWYVGNGFAYLGNRKFDGLPFTVGFMEWTAD